MEQINQNEKTLVFCATQDHALAPHHVRSEMQCTGLETERLVGLACAMMIADGQLRDSRSRNSHLF
jgi:hypothetical protein